MIFIISSQWPKSTFYLYFDTDFKTTGLQIKKAADYSTALNVIIPIA